MRTGGPGSYAKNSEPNLKSPPWDDVRYTSVFGMPEKSGHRILSASSPFTAQRGRRDWFRAAAAEASAMLCQWEWLALFVGGGGIELLEAPLS
jgi:hypothetical protein